MANQLQINPLSNSEVSSFCGQMAMILNSGISSIEGISIMLEDAKSKEEELLLGQIKENLEQTGNFYQALESTNAYPAYMLHMVKIGEETGKLDEVMSSLRDHYDREDNISKSIKNAITYPLIMISMMVIVILVLMVKVMPIFNQVFIQLGQEMTGFSKAIMTAGNAISRYSVVFVVLIVAIIGLIIFFRSTKKGRRAFMSFGYHIPFIRDIYENIAACRFTSGMALTLNSGMNTDQGLELVEPLIENPYYQEKLAQVQTVTSEGGDFHQALASTEVLTGTYARMASLGNKTGTLDDVLAQISNRYQDEIDNKINNLLAILEPTIVIALSLVVGIILLSVMLPLLGIMSSI